MPRTPEQYEQIRNEKKKIIIGAALQLFAEKGYAATSVSQIAEKAGISKGLMYNYFESKEELLKTIMSDFIDEIIRLVDPNNDDEISEEEGLSFMDSFFDMLKNRTGEMKLYYQLSFQPEVMAFILSEKNRTKSMKQRSLILSFFTQQHKSRPDMLLLSLASVLKGFSMQYVFVPELFPDEVLMQYKEYLKDEFVRKNK